MTDRSKHKIVVSTALVFVASLSVVSGHFAFAESYDSYATHYNIGHHEGALMASIDEQSGYYNTDCHRYTPGSHTDAYCNGYFWGYNANWKIFHDRHIILHSNSANQGINQRAQIHCFILCINTIHQRASEAF